MTRPLIPTVAWLLLLGVSGVLGLGAWGLAAPPKPATTAAATEAIGPGVQLDWSRGVITATGSCAADLFAASADVARVKAERLARLRAEERLRKALQELLRDKARVERLGRFAPTEQLARLDPTRATVERIDYAATGSVSLLLVLPLRPSAAAPADAGAPPADAEAAPIPRE